MICENKKLKGKSGVAAAAYSEAVAKLRDFRRALFSQCLRLTQLNSVSEQV
jgi:hypothetical protein